MKVETNETAANDASDAPIRFPQGLPGFEGAQSFHIYHEADQPTLFTMQSTDDAGLQFSVTDPAVLKVQYELTLSDAECQILELENPDDISVMVLLYQKDDEAAIPAGNNIHANFMGPLIVNAKSRIGIQKVLTQVEDFVTIRAG